MRTNVNGCNCTRCLVTVRESALKVDSGRKIPCRTRESNLRQRRAGPTIYQLTYISIATSVCGNYIHSGWTQFNAKTETIKAIQSCMGIDISPPSERLVSWTNQRPHANTPP